MLTITELKQVLEDIDNDTIWRWERGLLTILPHPQYDKEYTLFINSHWTAYAGSAEDIIGVLNEYILVGDQIRGLLYSSEISGDSAKSFTNTP